MVTKLDRLVGQYLDLVAQSPVAGDAASQSERYEKLKRAQYAIMRAVIAKPRYRHHPGQRLFLGQRPVPTKAA